MYGCGSMCVRLSPCMSECVFVNVFAIVHVCMCAHGVRACV